MQPGDLVTLDITDIAHGGVFVARRDGRVVFVAGAIPGERVVARVTEVKKSYARADAVDVLHASPDRQPHIWTEADVTRPPEDRPGGADLGHIRLERQRQLKADVLHAALGRFAGTDIGERFGAVGVAPAGAGADAGTETADGSGWRTRVSIHVDRDGRMGPVAARSNRVIDVAEWPLLQPDLGVWAASLGRVRQGRVDGVRTAGGEIYRTDRAEQARGRRKDPRVITERAAGVPFQLDVGGFWQVHRLAADTLYAAVGRAARRAAEQVGGWDADGEHLDLYGGVGLFAHAIGSAIDGGRVLSVESDHRASAHAGSNLAGLGPARAVSAAVEKFMQEAPAGPTGLVVLDPPRAGAGNRVVTAIAGRRPRAVLYVACDPVALARDLKTFGELGYAPVDIEAFDLFPNSHHFETLALLTAAH